MTCASTLRRPRWAMPMQMFLHAKRAAALDDLLQRPESSTRRRRDRSASVPVNFRSQNFSKPSASISLLRIARLPCAR